MRHALFLAGLLAASPAPADAPASQAMNVRLDVPLEKGPQHVNVLVREFPVGGSSGWHTHPGVEIAYLLAGEMSLEQQGQPTRRLAPGDSFMVPRGVAHNGVNLGKVPARLVITYVVDRDAPPRTGVPAPAPAPTPAPDPEPDPQH
jgi:quercetin dioxygenase-like cupin family protein